MTPEQSRQALASIAALRSATDKLYDEIAKGIRDQHSAVDALDMSIREHITAKCERCSEVFFVYGDGRYCIHDFPTDDAGVVSVCHDCVELQGRNLWKKNISILKSFP